ncbi:hypothetical protein CUJ88_32755 [Paraburkholderia hospita]|nr:hypothetical protein CUJ88_32755 [Paraburkholderia hospita]
MSRHHRHLLPGKLQLAVLSSPRPCLPLRSITAAHLLRILLHRNWLKDTLQVVMASVRVRAVRVRAVRVQAVPVQAVWVQAVRVQAVPVQAVWVQAVRVQAVRV